MEIRNDLMFVTGKMELRDKSINHQFLVHSGYGGTILLDDEFAKQHQLASDLKIISESQLRDSFGNVLKTKKARLPKMSFGNSGFSDLPVNFFDGAIGRQKMSVMGGNVMKRFNLIIDKSNSSLYIKPNKLFDSKFES